MGDWRDYSGIEVLHMTALESAGGVRAFFTGRSGGVSDRWSGGLNWSYTVENDKQAVQENRRRTLDLLGLPLSRAVMAGLVHGDRVVAVTGEEPRGSHDEVRLVPECDALITDQPGIALIVTAADCVPIFLYDPVRRAISAIHAGWRGTVAGIAGRAAEAMQATYGCRPENMLAAVGPSIGPCCYEVDDAVAGPLRQYYGEAARGMLTPVAERPGKFMLDLWEANRRDLERAGITRVSISGTCTSCGTDRLFSHRAERGTAGRGAAVITLV